MRIPAGFAFGLAGMLSICCPDASAGYAIMQNSYGGGDNVVAFASLDPKFRLTFASRTSAYTGPLAGFAQLDNPPQKEWLKAVLSGRKAGKRPAGSEIDLAYAQFQQGKGILEEDPCIVRRPVTPRHDSQSDTLAPVTCQLFETIMEAVDVLDGSFRALPNAWTRLYRAMAYVRMRAFDPGNDELAVAERELRRAGQTDAAEFAKGYRATALAWKAGRDDIFMRDRMQFTCPLTPNKTREALGQPLGMCTLLFCGRWTGYDDPDTRGKTILTVLDKTLDGLHGKSRNSAS